MKSKIVVIAALILFAGVLAGSGSQDANAGGLTPEEAQRVLSTKVVEEIVSNDYLPQTSKGAGLNSPAYSVHTRTYRAILVEMVSFTRGESETESTVTEDFVRAKVTSLEKDGTQVGICINFAFDSSFIKCTTGNVTNPAGTQHWVNKTSHRWEHTVHGDISKSLGVTGDW